MKPKGGYSTIDEYVATFPPETRKILGRVRSTIQKAAPKAVEAISYQMPTYKLNGKNLVHFACWKHHVGFYPTPSATSKFKKELSAYKGAKGSVQFPLDEPMPLDLIRRMVKFRLDEMEKKSRK